MLLIKGCVVPSIFCSRNDPGRELSGAINRAAGRADQPARCTHGTTVWGARGWGSPPAAGDRGGMGRGGSCHGTR